MTFKRELQALCDKHNVKLMPGLHFTSGDGQTPKAVHAVMYAYKLGDDGKVQQSGKIVSVIPRAERALFE